MRIVLDARKLHDFGIGTYIRNLIGGLGALDTTTDFILLTKPGDAGTALATAGANFRTIDEPAKPYSMREQWRIPLAAARARADLLHEPHYVLSPLTRCRTVVTIHDCIHLRLPEYLPSRAAYLYAHAMIRAAARKADCVLTVSEASKRDILHYTGVSPDKVTVVYNSVDARFAAAPAAATIERVQQRFQLDHPFVLYVGNIKPHKNLERLIAAFAAARPDGPEGLKLVVIGDETSNYPSVRQAVHRHRLDKHVRFFGFQPASTLVVFYRLAHAFVFPSLYEGFGLPPLEAMANETPVVTSNVSSLPEVAGDAALLVDPYDVASIADGIRRAVSDEPLRQELIRRGRERARRFSWTKAATETLAVYRRVLGAA
ncbi:MAG TPA: glycosyltransferase family 1 protein [Vicinamibacterales bacterium]|nr:glycosyltransferase family 1 protein [Vicinamibacterales bacterium]